MNNGFPDAGRAYPVTLPDGSEHRGTVFLNKVIDHPGWAVGDYTYASDFEPPTDWASRLAPYQFGSGRDMLRIGKFCQIAHGVRFLTAGANHAVDGVTTFPFPIFDADRIAHYQPDTRDTTIGHDVWLGYGALVCPGAQIGNGVIVGAGAVVRGTVPDYAVLSGNPARVARMRFDPDTVNDLTAVCWWDWPADKVARAVPALLGGDIAALKRI
ncbi:MAG: CatB-related O-acetyltransferase [Pseudomonadota bacterium]